MRITTFLLPTLLTGFVIGQYTFTDYYNPHNLEENALEFTQQAYESGCISAKGNKDVDCKRLAEGYRSEIANIFHNKIWKDKE